MDQFRTPDKKIKKIHDETLIHAACNGQKNLNSKVFQVNIQPYRIWTWNNLLLQFDSNYTRRVFVLLLGRMFRESDCRFRWTSTKNCSTFEQTRFLWIWKFPLVHVRPTLVPNLVNWDLVLMSKGLIRIESETEMFPYSLIVTKMTKSCRLENRNWNRFRVTHLSHLFSIFCHLSKWQFQSFWNLRHAFSIQ